MAKLYGIFKQLEERTFTKDICFLCGCLLNSKNKTVEHVIPKWLQSEFNLWDQQLTLLNLTSIPYRQLTIPCCFKCNNVYLKKFEDRIHKAFNKGFDTFQNLDQNTIFLWLGKIYFGLMYRELFLNLDRKNPEVGTITNGEYLKGFYSHLLFLQGIRNRHKFNNFFPASIHLFKTQIPKNIEERWDLVDNHFRMFIAIRMGEIGIIAVLQDGGAVKELEGSLNTHKTIDLHPIQFRELAAQILYKGMLMNRTPKFVNNQYKNKVETFMSPLGGLSAKPIFDEWDNETYTMILSHFTSVPLEHCRPGKDKAWTWLADKNGKSLFIDVNE